LYLNNNYIKKEFIDEFNKPENLKLKIYKQNEPIEKYTKCAKY